MKENTGAAPQLNIAKEASLPYNSLSACGEGRGEVAAPRREGGQPGNQNARVHGFYSRNAPVARQEIIDEASQLEGLDAEISFLRSCLEYVSEMDPPNPKLAGELVRTLSIAMVRRKYSGHNVLIEKAKRILGNVGVVAGAVGGVVEVVQVVKK